MDLQPMPATESPVTGVAYRRNGKLFSCEPCRKGKLRCDHTSPVCGRCTRRGRESECVYHPAPLTKPREARSSPYPKTKPSGLISPPLESPNTRVQRQAQAQAEAQETVQDMPRPYPTEARPVFVTPAPVFNASPVQSQHISERTGPSTGLSVATSESCLSYKDSKHGFLGPTAFTAVFTEHSESTGFEEIETGNVAVSMPTPLDKLERGASVLALLRDMPLFRQFTKRWFDHYDGLIILSPTFRVWYDDLWNEWGELLTHGTPAQLLRLSELVCKNTRQLVRTTKTTTAREWSKAFTGRNLRWEVVGSILSLVALVAANLGDWDLIFDDMGDDYVTRAEFADRMRKASEICLCFCYESEALNDAYVTFMFQDLILVGCRKGEVHYASWQRMGELVDTTVALGMHRGNYVDSQTPFWLSELRRKLFVMIYSRDKELSSFLGRPPRLSIRYCKIEMPVELTDDELFLEGAELEAAMSKLDSRGWSSAEGLSRRRWERVQFLEMMIREEILEIALGCDDDDLESKIDSVKQRLADVHQQVPSSIRVSVESVFQGAGVGAARSDRVLRHINALYVVCINIGFDLEEFLLQRAVVNRGKEATSTLIPICRKLLQTVLLVYSRRDFFNDFRNDIVWLLASHGLPSAGVLAVELLKQEQTRQYDVDLPKSDTIQDLSVFIAALATVDSSEGNYNICNQGRRALKRVLDQILTPSAPMLQSDPSFFDNSLYFPAGNDADFLQWLDNIDWDKNFAQPTDAL